MCAETAEGTGHSKGQPSTCGETRNGRKRLSMTIRFKTALAAALFPPHTRVPSHSQIYSLKFILEKGRTDCPIVGAHCLHTRKCFLSENASHEPFLTSDAVRPSATVA